MPRAFPLDWPEAWPRTPAHETVDGRSKFMKPDRKKGYGSRSWTFAEAREALLAEILRIDGADAGVVSSNWPLTAAGHANPNAPRPHDQAVAVWIRRYGKVYAFACDRFSRAEENMRSLTLAIEAMRQLERHGGSVLANKAMSGFAALPPPPSCWEVLGLQPGASATQIDAAYRARARAAHPDNGGSNSAMAALNSARDAARAYLQAVQ